jgi:hypothetical protein
LCYKKHIKLFLDKNQRPLRWDILDVENALIQIDCKDYLGKKLYGSNELKVQIFKSFEDQLCENLMLFEIRTL